MGGGGEKDCITTKLKEIAIMIFFCKGVVKNYMLPLILFDLINDIA